jgi:sec-independent protein translocase protein TatA
MLSGNEIWIVVLVIALIFGASRLPVLGRNIGQGIKEFRKGVGEAKADKADKADRSDSERAPQPRGDQLGSNPDRAGPDGRIGDRRD